MAKLTDLSNDMLAMIISLLYDESPHTLSSVASVNSRLNNLARYYQHRTMTLVVHDNNLMDARLRVAEARGILPAIQKIRLIGRVEHAKLRRFCTLLPRLTGLKDLVFDTYRIPDRVLKVIRELPQLRLHARFCDHRDFCDLSNRQATYFNIANMEHCLYKLEASYTHPSYQQCRELSRALKKILLTCTNLRILALDIGRLPKEQYIGIGFAQGERPPPLEELHIRHYPFANPGSRYSINSIGYVGEIPELQYWAENFDWSELKSLKDGSLQLASLILPKLTRLREVSFECPYGNIIPGSAQDFFQQVPTSLESISIPSLDFIGIKGISRHASSLRRLRLYVDEPSNNLYSERHRDDWRRLALRATSLQSLRDACSSLQELVIVLARDREWPYEALDVLASFPRLRLLHIFFELGPEESPVVPYVTFGAVGHLFSYLRSQPRHPGPKRLLVDVGGWKTRRVCKATWPKENCLAFRCDVAERDDDAARGAFDVTCTDLDADANLVMRVAHEAGTHPLRLLASRARELRSSRHTTEPDADSGRSRGKNATSSQSEPEETQAGRSRVVGSAPVDMLAHLDARAMARLPRTWQAFDGPTGTCDYDDDYYKGYS